MYIQWIILPEEGRFSDVEARLDADVLHEARALARRSDVTLTMPRFGFETTLQLSDLLKGMHMPDAFCPAMDYGGMVQGGGLCVSTAVHRATITVDEEGTEAAAATMAVFLECVVQEAEITIDRPFVFAIVARESGAILFLGRVLDPSVG